MKNYKNTIINIENYLLIWWVQGTIFIRYMSSVFFKLISIIGNTFFFIPVLTKYIYFISFGRFLKILFETKSILDFSKGLHRIKNKEDKTGIIEIFLYNIHLVFFLLVFLQLIYFLKKININNIWDSNTYIYSIILITLVCLTANYYIYIAFTVEARMALHVNSYFYFFSPALFFIFLTFFNNILFKTNNGLFIGFFLPIIFIAVIYNTSSHNFMMELFRIGAIVLYSFIQNLLDNFSLTSFVIVIFLLFWFGIIGPLIVEYFISRIFIRHIFTIIEPDKFLLAVLNISLFLRKVSKKRYFIIFYYFTFGLTPLVILWFVPLIKNYYLMTLVFLLNVFMVINILERNILENYKLMLSIYELKRESNVIQAIKDKVDTIMQLSGSNEAYLVHRYLEVRRKCIVAWAQMAKVTLQQEFMGDHITTNMQTLHNAYAALELSGDFHNKSFLQILYKKIFDEKGEMLENYLLLAFIDVVEQQWLEIEGKLWDDFEIGITIACKINQSMFFVLPQNYNLISRLIII